jgi:ABC-type tungstate transport system permease subunit
MRLMMMVILWSINKMTDFEQALKTAAEQTVLKIISDGSWLEYSYRDRFKIPAEFVTDVWNLVDVENLKKELAVRIEEELANRIINHIASEMATDIKQILSVKERREALRSIARKHIDSVIALGE